MWLPANKCRPAQQYPECRGEETFVKYLQHAEKLRRMDIWLNMLIMTSAGHKEGIELT